MASCGTLTVEAAFDPSLVSVSSCTGGNTNVAPGDSVDINLFLTNTNDQSATVDIEVTADGTVVGTRSGLSVPANTFEQSRRVTITAPSTGGKFSIKARKTSVRAAAAGAVQAVAGLPGVSTERGTLATLGVGAAAAATPALVRRIRG